VTRLGARYAAAITYATLHTAMDAAARETFALGYARTAYPTPGAYFRCAPDPSDRPLGQATKL
jgi:hypothetical protein